MNLDRVRLGTAPDSWGVWFPDDPAQIPWEVFLDEVVAAGYAWLELGPYGYLPTDPARLADELGGRGLKLSGGAVAAGLHRGDEALARAIEDCRVEAELLTALGAEHLVLLPESYTELDGRHTQPAELTAEQRSTLHAGMSQLGKVVAEDLGLELVFHPHADSHVGTQPDVERFLSDTDPSVVNLCLDTGHISYHGGDNVHLIERYPERIGYVHLKQVDPQVVTRVEREGLAFAEAVRLGVMVEPPRGVPAMEPVLAALSGVDADLFAIVEQDLYPCDAAAPLPIARRTRAYLGGCGLGTPRGRKSS
ncbi:MAG TPA: TIM barrel protein [Mycobacteriales bacterium]|jgi:inosose dehydratase|nr:TIM barrel protein [Mycobacteriales bacterium]